MVHAFVLIRTGPGASKDVRSALSDIQSVMDAHVVAGEFDLIAEVGGEEVYDVLSTASDEVQSVSGVEETKTYISLSA
ncbi:MAG: Lrp/AsnC ligand binding domain-containing protein [Halodesulfurarchaeum sp.]